MSAGKIGGRRKTFAEKVAEGHTATEAYFMAGYRPAKRETAHRAASRLYANPGIRAYIRELRRTGDDLAREETALTIARKLTFLAVLFSPAPPLSAKMIPSSSPTEFSKTEAPPSASPAN